MNSWTRADSRIRKFRLIDVQFLKLSKAALVLVIDRLWNSLLSLGWQRHARIAMFAAINQY